MLFEHEEVDSPPPSNYEIWQALSHIQARDPEGALRSLIRMLRQGTDGEHRWAAMLLESIGPAAKDAAPALRELLGHRLAPVRARAARALFEMDAEPDVILPALIALLKAPEKDAANVAAMTIASLGSPARSAIPALAGCLEEPPRPDPEHATKALAALGSEAVEPLLGLLAHSDVAVRRAAVKGLGELAREEEGALRGLMRALKDEDQGVIDDALNVLGALGPRARGAEAHVLEVLEKKPGARLKKQAISALGEIGGSAGAVRAILDAVRESSAPGMALEALAKMAIPKELVHLVGPECQKLRDDASPVVRIWARCILVKLDPHEEADAMMELTTALNDVRSERRHAAVGALGCLGEAARQAAPALARIALRDDKDYIRRAAARSLQKIGMDDVASIAAALSASDADERLHAAEALAELGPLGAAAVTPLLSALEDEDPKLRMSAARALGRIGAKAAPALPALKKALGDRFRSFRDEARNALQKIERGSNGAR